MKISHITAALAAAFTLATATTHAATYYVDASRPNDTGAGTTWATAKRTIQAAIDVATANDTIIVTNGVYAPSPPITNPSPSKASTVRV